eukprot:SAG11_NODE_24793_length_368_cov_0.605948_1_plen_71_part_10
MAFPSQVDPVLEATDMTADDYLVILNADAAADASSAATVSAAAAFAKAAAASAAEVAAAERGDTGTDAAPW